MEKSALHIRPAQSLDREGIWRIIGPVIRKGETYALPRQWGRRQALAYWMDVSHRVYVAVASDEQIVGTYYLHSNQMGGGQHIANAGFVAVSGHGAGRLMGEHAIEEAGRLGFRAMQFNCVVSTNLRAIELWKDLGFRILTALPGAFEHPTHGYVDALIMWQDLPQR
ncbi:GNAT family N-acetyltransferase [Gluconobacter wancherniae]|uniref:GNAT family N-acetyltransferase n=1 Tax=Gluconobacter wancherniae TaxID=1307955 RepID=UPI001B8C5B25|nr:GNAT family N-acetyltransferase [Gluconobacter wancherniae]MBS1063365.1 GNAT family N-acetyltransferase [Gluconobacter wancherniae]MBS1088216.1 GNAT family N-acetyltransferase [Gluconobacter wancherniae]